MAERGPLAQLIDRGWYAATDTADGETVDGVEPEAIYRLGFVNGLQATMVGAARGGADRDLLAAALMEAADLMELEV